MPTVGTVSLFVTAAGIQLSISYSNQGRVLLSVVSTGRFLALSANFPLHWNSLFGPKPRVKTTTSNGGKDGKRKSRCLHAHPNETTLLIHCHALCLWFVEITNQKEGKHYKADIPFLIKS